ncbi:hypothetical protein BGLT_06785 [Caballeronia glathei]|uniref:Uncharacterized protein n=1 Tax=Caballeronia glathei TaxID=60547 RepID=A0A069PV46_9BURK|nr:hypothetical protein [Caballeronia glathei]KDR41176.1 hypothetical protein BG61_20805 [Caballeronia glathei]CDY77979.1 hypothetical protein BGLT_06785 [Caballeronia glathei]
MSNRIPVTDAEIAKEHRLRGVRGSASSAITNAAIRICLTNCAELRKKQHHPEPLEPDLKRLAAGDID